MRGTVPTGRHHRHTLSATNMAAAIAVMMCCLAATSASDSPTGSAGARLAGSRPAGARDEDLERTVGLMLDRLDSDVFYVAREK